MPQGNPVRFTATPTLSGNSVKWTLCHTNPPGSTQPVCGNNNGSYPDVTLDKGVQNYVLKFEIVGDNTGLDHKFANPGKIIKSGNPTGPADNQIGPESGGASKTLTFVDFNTLPSQAKPAPVKISYGLKFVDKNGVVSTIDPDITNGGTNTIISPPGAAPPSGGGGENMFANMNILLIGATLLALVIGFAIGRFWR